MCTYRYKSGWIHTAFSFGPETYKAQTSDYKVHRVKSYRAAQPCAIRPGIFLTTTKGENVAITVSMPDGSPYTIQRLLANERSNAKLIKARKKGMQYLTFGLSMAPAKVSGYQVCSSSSPGCRKACIFTSGNGGYPNVSKCRIARTIAWFEHRENFKDHIMWEMELARKLSVRQNKQLCVRMNVFSDVMYEREFKDFFDRNQDAQIYDYTKHYLRMVRFCKGDLPPNLYLTFSRSENNWDKCLDILNRGRNISVPFTINKVMRPEINVPLPELYEGFPVFNGEDDDLRFLDPQQHIIGIKTKGMGFWDKSGFIVDLMGDMWQEKEIA